MVTINEMMNDLDACTTQSSKVKVDLMRGIAALERLTEIVLPCEQDSDAAATALMHMYAAFAHNYRATFHAARAADTAARFQEAQALREAIDNEPPPPFDEDDVP